MRSQVDGERRVIERPMSRFDDAAQRLVRHVGEADPVPRDAARFPHGAVDRDDRHIGEIGQRDGPPIQKRDGRVPRLAVDRADELAAHRRNAIDDAADEHEEVVAVKGNCDGRARQHSGLKASAPRSAILRFEPHPHPVRGRGQRMFEVELRELAGERSLLEDRRT
ncbi:MAG: hypothetical protein JOZ54_10365, partial [Acidobacteria bacterium]|nr:hypothetical protein [Acidobacteriota bacterium]